MVNPAAGTTVGFDPAPRADEADRARRVATRDQLVGQRERRKDVTAGSASADEREGHVRHGLLTGSRAVLGARCW